MKPNEDEDATLPAPTSLVFFPKPSMRGAKPTLINSDYKFVDHNVHLIVTKSQVRMYITNVVNSH